MKNQIKIAVVVAQFNEYVTRMLLQGAVDEAQNAGVEIQKSDIFHVPGAFEIPFIAKRLASKGAHQAIVCLGAVIRGETPHFDHVATQSAAGLMRVSLDFNIPVINGVLTTDTVEQALNRSGLKSGNKGRESMHAALHMIKLSSEI